MKVIRPNCRAQFTPADFNFIAESLWKAKESGENTPDLKIPAPNNSNLILRLCQEEDSVDSLLDSPVLYRELLNQKNCLSISMHLYFYVLVRHALCREEIANRELADYIAEVLAEYALIARLRNQTKNEFSPLDYLFEMILEMDKLPEMERFSMASHIGNYALFLSGLYPNRLLHQSERRGAPGFQYYEEIGSAYFKMAEQHSLARKFDLVSIYHCLGEDFHTTRLALNEISEKVFFMETNRAVIDLFKEIDKGPGFQ